MNRKNNTPNETVLEQRLRADADDWRHAMPGRVELVNPADSGASLSDRAPKSLAGHRPARLPLALAAVVLLGIGLFMIVNRPDRTQKPIDTSTASQFARSLVAGVEGLEDPLAREVRGLADDTRAAAVFLVARIPGGQEQ